MYRKFLRNRLTKKMSKTPVFLCPKILKILKISKISNNIGHLRRHDGRRVYEKKTTKHKKPFILAPVRARAILSVFSDHLAFPSQSKVYNNYNYWQFLAKYMHAKNTLKTVLGRLKAEINCFLCCIHFMCMTDLTISDR